MSTNPYPFIPYAQRPDDLDDATMATIAQYWTETTADLAPLRQAGGAAARIAEHIAADRLGIARFDYPRTDHWIDPEGVDVFADMPYLPDGGYDNGQVRGHLLDLYLPHERVLTGGNTCPVFIDIHGGGFSYGYKELNRNFCTHLAALGFAVFSLNYRPAPQTNLAGQLADIQAALRWIRDAANAGRWPISPSNMFLTGDSAGGALAWLTMVMESDRRAAAAFGIVQGASGLPLQGAALVSGVFDLGAQPQEFAVSVRKRLADGLGDAFFDGIAGDGVDWLNPADALAHMNRVPAVYLVTSSDDFVQSESLHLATLLAQHGADFQLNDVKVPCTQTLGHVFPVCLTWLAQSVQVLEQIRDFALTRCR
ncbi:alpha/beta hydrolase [Bifidobacterium gallicum]|uniref:Hydrolase, alpha/beta domain protein n=1 Tax=Bifidobacterium gallicum DSM 20093 = LMG 11596 TaxID=561180 RepID=D1NS15_9BIFI|nr:alpha/beta hydrolase [Bifidobacterium gallicum]EFA23467.1 hydrolase, alpha/beta domain protein [Bifidobacterium gallicum DSM 20093 = LMG 11596]KFI57245.1 putative alpha/beta hydrolase fold protein [Bifidobacterium gallicum DSM 20093 = LMG 11596]